MTKKKFYFLSLFTPPAAGARNFFFFFLKCSLPLSPVSRSLYPLPALSVIRITNKSMEVEEQEEKPLSLFPLNSLLPPPLLSYPCCAAALALAAALAPAPTACSTFP